ncbi:MAG TPA: GAF domain-containing protein [Burkholderiales bacterium]|nr:GAF domain-containing protein [Burkholderiales bacterium]
MSARPARKRSPPRSSPSAGATALRRRLRELEQRYELVMSAVEEGVYDWNLTEDTIFYSDSVKRAVGLPPSQLRTPDDWSKRIHPDDLPRYRAALIDHFKGKSKRFDCDYRYRARDGTWRWARQHGIALRDRRGRAVRMIGSTGDVTELKQSDLELHHARDQAVQALAEQTAVRGVLEALSRSAFDLGAVLHTLIESATRLCRAEKGFIFRLEREGYRLAVNFGASEHFREFIERHPIRPGRGTLVGRTAVEGRTVHIEDAATDPEYVWHESQRLGGFHTMLGVPIVRNGVVIGVIALWKERVEPFTPAQIALVSSFSNQALIAIENARLFHATSEALDQQIAIGEVLRMIASSPGEVQPVLDAVAERAARMCGAEHVDIFLVEPGGAVRVAATVGDLGGPLDPIPLDRRTVMGRSILDRAPLQVDDVQNAGDSLALGAQLARKYGHRTVLGVPLLRENEPLGTILLRRAEVRPFEDKDIALLKTFADQAAIAIDTARLFSEIRESLEQQHASAEVLKVISSSIADTAPVFDKILESCQRLFAGRIVGLNLMREDGMLHLGAYHGANRPEFKRTFPYPANTDSGSGLSIVERRVVHFPDAEHGENVPPKTRQGCRTLGIKSVIFAPVLWEGRGLGAIFVGREQVSAFSEKEIALLRVFADQAAIAIENVRLFNETREALEQQTATSDILRVISASPTDVQPVFEAIVRSGVRLFAGAAVAVTRPENGEVRLMAIADRDPRQAQKWRKGFPVPLTRGYMHGAAILDCRRIDMPDVREMSEQFAAGKENFAATGYRAMTVVPMVKDHAAIGTLSVVRLEPGPLSGKQIALLETFADQAVIAIENVRLFNEIEQKSRQLEAASRHKSEFLANMSHELRTPLNAIIGFTRIVMRRSRDQIEPQQYENLEKILASGQHLLALINSVLDLAKVESGHVDINPSEVALAPVLEQCVRTVEPLIKGDAVSLVREFDGALPQVYVDEDKLRQIVLNLLGNAVKFTARGSVRLHAHANDGSVAIAVVDTGIGIPPDKLNVIFEEFEQVDASSTRVHGGTGLGLAIARRLARLMGGEIVAESVLGSGSRFTLTLPARYRAG